MNSIVSIITVVYNAYENFSLTIESVKGQSYNSIEYIEIDGGSTDGTLDIIEENRDSISKVVSEPDKGIYDAMNKGIDLATGVWLMFLNAGDVFSKNN